MATAVHESPRRARAARPLDVGAPLAVAHGTRYPIVQGPMTRVSDGAAFAEAVATGGALPLIALALMPGPEVRTLLREVRTRLAGRPWGVGILGFVPPDVRHAQLEALQDSRPPFALIAGGRPDQASQLEAAGTRTYLHVPSPGLLRLFLAEGARRFVLEGRECGGHVGPLGSLALWELAVETLLEAGSPSTLADVQLLFAGGIHDGASAAAAAVLAGPLLERGVRIGVLVGTAYLFTEEAVGTGAVRPGFQAEAIGCERTVLLETGPGHATRCAASPFVARFRAERRRLEAMGAPAEEVRRRLEALNLGRLRIATKGLARPGTARRPRSSPSPDAEQRCEGLFMLGQVALLRNARTTIAALHADVSAGGTDRIAASTADAVAPPAPAHPAPLDLAIVGMSCLVPGAADLAAFWRNVLTKASAIAEVPAERWDWRRYFDPAVGPGDRTPSRWGGFLPDVPFDPVSFGIAPNSLGSIEPVQLLTLLAVRAALADAGYQTRPFDRERTAVIVGTGGGGDLAQLYGFRALLPDPARRRVGRRAVGSRPPAAALDGGFLPRDPPQRHGRARREPVRPRRAELHGGRRVRLLARGRLRGGPRAPERVERRRRRGRGRHAAGPVRLSVLREHARPLPDRAVPPVRRGRGRHRDQRRHRGRRPQTAARRRARRRSHLRGGPGARRRQRRAGSQVSRPRAPRGSFARCAAPTPRPGSRPRRSAWSRRMARGPWPATAPSS